MEKPHHRTLLSIELVVDNLETSQLLFVVQQRAGRYGVRFRVRHTSGPGTVGNSDARAWVPPFLLSGFTSAFGYNEEQTHGFSFASLALDPPTALQGPRCDPFFSSSPSSTSRRLPPLGLFSHVEDLPSPYPNSKPSPMLNASPAGSHRGLPSGCTPRPVSLSQRLPSGDSESDCWVWHIYHCRCPT